MSSVIIYGSFKLIITERLPVIGTFFSQGATRGNVRKVLYLESILYGIIGGGLGGLFGTGILYMINYMVSPLREYGIIEPFNFNGSYIISGFIFALLLSVLSCMMPIRRTNKLEVKDVILSSVDNSKELGWSKFIAGAAILILTVLVNSSNKPWVVEFSPLLLIVSFVGLILMYPKVMDLITSILFQKSKGAFNSAGLALNNVTTSKSLRGNVTLIIISILAIVIINSVGVSLKETVIEAYTELRFDISIDRFKNNDIAYREKLLDTLERQEGVDKDSIQQTFTTVGKAEGKNVFFVGVEPSKYKDHNKYLKLGSEENAPIYREFESGSSKGVIVSTTAAKGLGVSKGDTIEMELNGIVKQFKVLGVINGKLYINGNFIIISKEDLREDFKYMVANTILLNTTKEPELVKKDIEKLVRQLGGTISTFEEQKANNIKQNQQLIDILSIFSLMAIFIGALGAINNMLISFIQRKKELAVLSSVGMTTGQRGVMLMIESLLCVVWSTAIVTPYCYLVVSLISKCTELMGMPLEIRFDVTSMVPFFITSIIIFIIATLPVLFNNKKLSIIQEIKYE